MTRTSYCRACGENKGHSFSKCKNFSGLRQIIILQDNELAGKQDEVNRIQDLAYKEKIATANNAFLQRLLICLLDLVEAKRSVATAT